MSVAVIEPCEQFKWRSSIQTPPPDSLPSGPLLSLPCRQNMLTLATTSPLRRSRSPAAPPRVGNGCIGSNSKFNPEDTSCLASELSKLTISNQEQNTCSQTQSTATSSPSCDTLAEPMQPLDLGDRILSKCTSSSSSSLVLLDSRSFIAYNLSHIEGALNMSCSDRVTKKRLQCGRLKPTDLITCQVARERYSSCKDIVVYDDSTSELSQLTACSPLLLVLKALRKEGKSPKYLQGGLRLFQLQCPDLCKKPARNEGQGPLYSPTTPIIHEDIDNATACQILPYIYLGNERDAASLERLRELGITHVLNVTSGIPCYHETEAEIVYKRLSASDSGQQNLSQYFAEACSFIEEARSAEGRVLIHCQAGVSRSATVTIAYIMKFTEHAMMDAYKYVKAKRPIIAPNFNFMGQLLDLDRRLQAGEEERCLDKPLPL